MKHLKKIICLILALLLLCPAAFAAEDLTFTFSKAEGKVGDTVTIIASSKGAPVACSYRLVMVYDTKVLKPIEAKNIKSKGFFMSNIEATYEGKAAVNALSADAKKAFEGDCDLFSVTFEILSEPESGKSLIEIPYYECYSADLKMLDAAFDECSVTIAKDSASDPGNEGSENQGDNETAGDENQGNNENAGGENQGNNETAGGENQGNDETAGGETDGNESAPPASNNQTEQDSLPPKEESKEPTGQWDIFEKTEEITHSHDGKIDIYTGEFTRDENDKITDIQLFDEEGKPAGSLKVEEKEDGTIEVVEQDLSPATIPQKPFNHLYWILPLAALLIGGGIAAFLIITNKKKENEDQ